MTVGLIPLSFHFLSFYFLSFHSLSLLSQSHLTFTAPIAVGLGAVPGALSRYYVTVLLNRWFGNQFPFGTFFINLSGSLLMGFFATLIVDRTIPAPELQLLITAGFLGSYTTFSTYALDTSVLLQNKTYRKALFYWVGSSIVGVIFLEIGITIAHSLARGGN